MKIKDKDFYYGVVLTQIAEYPTFTTINKLGVKDGLYQITDERLILIKYSKADEGEWRFTFRKDDFNENSHLFWGFFIILVCGESTICLLSSNDIGELVDTSTEALQWISVNYPDGGQMRVKGSLGDLSHTVAHNAFPKELFDEEAKNRSTTDSGKWPPFSKLNFYIRPPTLVLSSEDRWLDLTDNLTNMVESGKPVYFGVTTISHLWETWTEDNLRTIEELIEEDITFDGYSVKIERITDPICRYSRNQDISCNREFLWKLKLYVATGRRRK
jgi:hypothetical protein